MYRRLGHLPICKECLSNMYSEYCVIFGDEKKAMQRICMAFDIYYQDSIMESCKGEDKKVIIGKYVRTCNMSPHRGKTFDTNLLNGFLFSKKKSSASDDKQSAANEARDDTQGEDEIRDFEPNPADVAKWGAGFTKEDYEILNNHYKGLMNANPGADSNQLIFIKNLCHTMMFEMRALREGDVDTYQKMSNLYLSIFSKSKLQMAQETQSAEEFKLGVTIDTIEKFTPAEFYKDKKLYKDFDGLGEYLERHVLRPLRNLQHGTADRDKEYHVKEEEEDGDIDA